MPKIKYPYKYDTARRKTAKRYVRGRMGAMIINGIVIPLIALYVFITTGAAGSLRDALLPLPWLAYVPVYAAILFMFLFIVRFPFMFYFSYVYEHKYGLSRYTLKAWSADIAKGLGLGYVFLALASLALFYFLQSGLWWLYAAAAYALFIIFINYAFPVIIFPLYYKTSSYKNKANISRLKSMAAKYGVRIKKVLLARESEKSAKANAFFAGFGHTKRIVLFDTLTNNFTPAETETVVAHELGHYVNHDIIRGMIIDIAKSFILFYIVSLFIVQAQDIALLPAVMFLYMIFDIIFMPLVNTYSRHREACADLFALNASRKPDAQMSAERRLVDMALDLESHHPLVEILLRSHPSASKRIKMCREWRKRQEAGGRGNE